MILLPKVTRTAPNMGTGAPKMILRLHFGALGRPRGAPGGPGMSRGVPGEVPGGTRGVAGRVQGGIWGVPGGQNAPKMRSKTVQKVGGKTALKKDASWLHFGPFWGAFWEPFWFKKRTGSGLGPIFSKKNTRASPL